MKTHLLAFVPLVYYTCFKFDPIKCFQVGTVLITSINYWRNPCKGVRRNIDIVSVFTINIYNAYIFPKIWIPIGIICFSIWKISNKLGDRRIHSLLHIVGCYAYFVTPKFKFCELPFCTYL